MAMESTGAKFGIGTNRAQYPALNQQARSFGRMGQPSLTSNPVAGTKPLAGGRQAAGMIQQPGPTMPRSGGMLGDNPVFKPRPPAGGVTGTLPRGLGKAGAPGQLKPAGTSARAFAPGQGINPLGSGGMKNPPMKNPTPTKGPVLGGVQNRGPRLR